MLWCLQMQVLQLGRVKKIVKQASDVKAVANDANFAIARATVSLKLAGTRHCCITTHVYRAVARSDFLDVQVRHIVVLSTQELFIEAMAEKSAKRTLADQRILVAYSDVGMLQPYAQYVHELMQASRVFKHSRGSACSGDRA